MLKKKKITLQHHMDMHQEKQKQANAGVSILMNNPKNISILIIFLLINIL